MSIYANIRALENSSVDTIIVCRCCLPLVVGFLEYIFTGRQLPGTRSALALVGLAIGATGYVLSDRAFILNGFSAYIWVSVYFWALCTSLITGKMATDKAPMKSMWGPALFSNFLSIGPTIIIALMTDEFHEVPGVNYSTKALVYLTLSCVFGVSGVTLQSCRLLSLFVANSQTSHWHLLV